MIQKGILFVTGTLEVGGSETKVVKIVNGLVKSGYNAGLAYLNSPETLLDRVDPAVRVQNLARRGKFSFQSLRRLRNLASHDYPILLSVNFYPLLYVLPAAKLNSSNEAKAICLINTTEFADSQWIWGYFYAPFLRRCNQLVYGCEAQRRLWTDRYQLPPLRSSVIYNGVNAERYSTYGNLRSRFRRDYGIPSNAVVFGSVGRLAPEKNFDLLIRATADLNASGRSAWLVLTGDGNERANLRAAADSCGIADKVIFTGLLNDVRPVLSAMDVFVLPSRAVETFSNAALEAMAMSRPVVLSNIGGAAEMIEDGRSGYLFPAGDRRLLWEILLKLYDSESMRSEAGKLARQRVIERFDFEAMLSQYKNLLDSAAH